MSAAPDHPHPLPAPAAKRRRGQPVGLFSRDSLCRPQAGSLTSCSFRAASVASSRCSLLCAGLPSAGGCMAKAPLTSARCLSRSTWSSWRPARAACSLSLIRQRSQPPARRCCCCCCLAGSIFPSAWSPLLKPRPWEPPQTGRAALSLRLHQKEWSRGATAAGKAAAAQHPPQHGAVTGHHCQSRRRPANQHASSFIASRNPRPLIGKVRRGGWRRAVTFSSLTPSGPEELNSQQPRNASATEDAP